MCVYIYTRICMWGVHICVYTHADTKVSFSMVALRSFFRILMLGWSTGCFEWPRVAVLCLLHEFFECYCDYSDGSDYHIITITLLAFICTNLSIILIVLIVVTSIVIITTMTVSVMSIMQIVSTPLPFSYHHDHSGCFCYCSSWLQFYGCKYFNTKPRQTGQVYRD